MGQLIDLRDTLVRLGLIKGPFDLDYIMMEITLANKMEKALND